MKEGRNISHVVLHQGTKLSQNLRTSCNYIFYRVAIVGSRVNVYLRMKELRNISDEIVNLHMQC